MSLKRCAEEATHRITPLAALPENQSSVPNTHIRQLTVACSSSCTGLNALFWPLQASAHTCAYVHGHAHFKKTVNPTASPFDLEQVALPAIICL